MAFLFARGTVLWAVAVLCVMCSVCAGGNRQNFALPKTGFSEQKNSALDVFLIEKVQKT